MNNEEFEHIEAARGPVDVNELYSCDYCGTVVYGYNGKKRHVEWHNNHDHKDQEF